MTLFDFETPTKPKFNASRLPNGKFTNKLTERAVKAEKSAKYWQNMYEAERRKNLAYVGMKRRLENEIKELRNEKNKQSNT